MFECGTCGRTFPAGWRAREQHLQATGHSAPNNECDTCDCFFASERARWQHMNASNHFAYVCRLSRCGESWPTKAQRKQHETDEHWWCHDCDRHFQSLNNIKMHLNSRTHRGQQIKCPFCQRDFTTATGLTHHLETGSCPKAAGLDRDKLYRLVRSKDPSGNISKHRIAWHGSDSFEATEHAWNYRCQRYQCYLCSRLFVSLQSLNQHLASPVHQQALYHCPGCRVEFTTLAGLINHLESETCGFSRFDKIQKAAYNIVSSNRLIAF